MAICISCIRQEGWHQAIDHFAWYCCCAICAWSLALQKRGSDSPRIQATTASLPARIKAYRVPFRNKLLVPADKEAWWHAARKKQKQPKQAAVMRNEFVDEEVGGHMACSFQPVQNLSHQSTYDINAHV